MQTVVSVPAGSTAKMVDEASDRDESSNVAIIREVYDSENAHETFEYELERALESECSLIVIEPSKLGDETSRWIAVGNCLHKTAALSGLAAIATGLLWGDRPYICGPLGFTSVITCGLYTVSWQFDPCCQYQVETDTSKLPHVELLAVLGPSSPTFLVRKDDKRRRILHTTITLAALGITAWRVYQAFK
ncbi:transmembrane protein 11 homolog, mitochondrial [Cardiocondyla obscurior]|uniref:transmembrane protein 11 homolog, mitochondrial n=1 Tax=Cardiocondyla obscurior TaxID=286306 RepID=UPI00396575B6